MRQKILRPLFPKVAVNSSVASRVTYDNAPIHLGNPLVDLDSLPTETSALKLTQIGGNYVREQVHDTKCETHRVGGDLA